MTNQEKKWQILGNGKNVVDMLLKNRGIKTEKEKKEFFNPTDPMKISLQSLDIKETEVKKAIDRIKKAKKKGEHIIVYGDYDADGIDGTAILWETLHDIGIFALPHIPDRFSEGYGLNLDSVKKLKEKDPKLTLIITVDHGIVAVKKIEEIKKLGIDVIISDHHQRGKIAPKALATIYTDKISGSGVAWFFAREIIKSIQYPVSSIQYRLELAAIGTIADQLPLIGPNRSIVKYGLIELNKTKRPGLLALMKDAGLEVGHAPRSVYEVGFIIAPRINSMGRLEHGLDSLRLLCTNDTLKAMRIAKHVNDTNSQRQKIVEEAVATAQSEMKIKSKGPVNKIIITASESYHEGVIGLAAARLVEEFYRPAIVLSKKGKISKASARSISGFNIIEVIQSLEDLYIEGGGHPMAAGFSIETKKIGEFTKRINKIARGLLTEEILSRKLRIDLEIGFGALDYKLMDLIKEFEPTGLGNPTSTFVSRGVELLDVKRVGKDLSHLKLRLGQNSIVFDAIYFGGGEIYSKLSPGSKVDVVFQIEENTWNLHTSLQLKIRDLQVS